MTEPDTQACDPIVDNGYLVTMDEGRREIAGGAVAVKEGRIVALGPAAEIVLPKGRSTRLDESAVLAAGKASAMRMAERVGG